MLAEQRRRCDGCRRSVVDAKRRRVVHALAHFGMRQLYPMATMAELRVVVDDICRCPDNACRHAGELQRRHQILRVPVTRDGGYALVDRVTIHPATMGCGELRRPRKGRITKNLTQSPPRVVLPGRNGNPSVLALAAKDAVRRTRRSFVAGALLDPIIGAAVAHRGPEQRKGWLALSRGNVLAHTCPSTVTKRCEDRKSSMARIWDMIGEVGSSPGRFALRKSGEELQTGQRPHRQTIAEVLVLGSRRALHRHRYVYDVWLDCPYRLVTETEFLHGAGGKVIGYDIARRNQALCQVRTSFGLEGERDASLAAVAVRKIAAAIDPRYAVFIGAAAAERIHPPAAFDFDDVGPMVGEELCRERPGADPGEVGDADAMKRQRLQLMT